MNIQQINSSGHNIGIFVITAILALLVTGASWFMSQKANEYEAWQHSRGGCQSSKGPSEIGYTRKARLFMLVWLARNGHTMWAWRSRAWWRIATDSNSRLCKVNSNIYLWNHPDKTDDDWDNLIKPFLSGKQRNAANYVVKFMDPRQRYKDLDPFALEDMDEEARKTSVGSSCSED